MTPPSLAPDADAALQACRRELAEALEQQAATREILGVISRLPADPQPVFEAIVAAGVRLFGDAAVAISRPDGDMVRPLAIAEADSERRTRWLSHVFPFPLSREYIHGAALLDCRVVDVPDLLEPGGPFEVGKRNVAPSGYRAMAVVPLVRDGRAVGAIAVVRVKPGRLSERQLAMLQTFADQALIAIENTRLSREREARNRELAEALEQQTATAEILRVIASSPTDVQPVFESIAQAALELCAARSANVFTFDGQLLHLAAAAIVDPKGLAAMRSIFPRPPSRDSAACRAVLTAQTVPIPDVISDPDFTTRDAAVAAGFRSSLGVPLIRDGRPIGAIAVGRPEPGPFPPRQVALLETFAAQAVIAIENTRLSREREARNRELAEALEQQTATGEILRVIARSPTDVQPVFDTIAQAALRLCEASIVNVLTFDGERLHVGALAGLEPRGEDAARAVFPRAPGRETVAGMAVLTRDVFVIEDVLRDEHYVFKAGADWRLRSALGLPLLRDGQPIGALAICRPLPGPFDAKLVALLRTFADQAVIALENVRLFNETAEALEHRTASAEVLQVISGSMANPGPVFEKILDSCAHLMGATDAGVFLVDGSDLSAAAWRGGFAEWVPASYPRPLAGTMSEAVIRHGAPRHWPDVATAPDVPEYIRAVVSAGENFSVAVAPLVWQGRGIGTLDVMRRPPRPYSDRELTLLRTFADQAVIAIQNARLFTALQDKTRELEIASRHKSAFLANMSHELRTPLNAVLGFTRIVLRETRWQIAPKQAENLEKILASARHLVGLINATLDLTRIEAGRIEITPSELVLAPLLDECVRAVEPLVAEDVCLDTCVPVDLPALRVDAEKLQQILINLLGNAVKFTERGRIELRARAQDDRVAIEIEDTGIGIPHDKLEAVFEEFEQVDASHARAHGGTGLGLAIARRLARAMGGDLTAVSALGRGSTFTLTLPLRWRDADES